MERQQVLYLWLAEGALESNVVAWAFHDGAGGEALKLPDADPPYPTGVAALEAGWFLLQSPQFAPHARGEEHDIGYLQNEFVFERRVAIT